MSPPVFSASAQRPLRRRACSFRIREEKLKTPPRAVRRHWRHYFFACLFERCKCFMEGEKEVLQDSLMIVRVVARNRGENYIQIKE